MIVALNLDRRLEQIEREVVKLKLDHNRGNIAKTAKELGISRSKVYRKLGRCE
jgi:DNA-binding NtrC family response regulator